jgi:hypothetical protein
MNEQEMADLFSTQIDRLLGGEPVVDLAVGGDSSLFSLGQLLIETNFQPSPAAQATFQSQLAGWFGPTGGGLSTSLFGWPKMLLMSIGAVLVLISAGLSSVVLISLIWTGALFTPSDDSQPVPAATQPATPSRPTLVSPGVNPTSPAATPTPTQRRSTSSLKDVLPSSTTAVGDTILRPTSTPTSTEVEVTVTATPNGNQSSDDAGDNNAPDNAAPEGDRDRGHGNDLDGYDEDNPGQSDGVSDGGNQNNSSGGISPDDLSGSSGGGGGGQSGNSNGGGGQGGNQGSNGGGQGGGKGNN